MNDWIPSADMLLVFQLGVEEGSFSAAARRLGRTQPAVSYAIAGLENQLAVTLFDRRGRRPVLTDHGVALLEDAKKVVQAARALQGRARHLAGGVEARISLALDQLFSLQKAREVLSGFRSQWPDVDLELRTETLGSVVQLVRDGVSDIGVGSVMSASAEDLVCEPLMAVEMVAVCAPEHPLAKRAGPFTGADLAAFVQLVITDRSTLTSGWSAGILSKRSWQLADLHTKHQLLYDGFGWGNMPWHLACDDLEDGKLVRLEVFPEPGAVSLQTLYRRDRPPGPAATWLLRALFDAVSVK